MYLKICVYRKRWDIYDSMCEKIYLKYAVYLKICVRAYMPGRAWELNACACMCVCVCMCVYVRVYMRVCIERERERAHGSMRRKAHR